MEAGKQVVADATGPRQHTQEEPRNPCVPLHALGGEAELRAGGQADNVCKQPTMCVSSQPPEARAPPHFHTAGDGPALTRTET